MKIYVGKNSSEYVEAKTDGRGSVDLSIRTSVEKKIMLITAKMDVDSLDKLIAHLIVLKTKIMAENG
jgi:hypothetical protein